MFKSRSLEHELAVTTAQSRSNGEIHPLQPFLRWPGGKRWAAKHIASIIGAHPYKTYSEPFLGGGALFFFLRPARARLSDINPDLIDTYKTVRDRPHELVCALGKYSVSKSAYYQIRAVEPQTPLLRAARFLYLNRTAFSGMYRLNKSGHFNVPYGGGERTPDLLLQTTILKDASAALRSAELIHSDFEAVMDAALSGDVVYCDPTYTVTHDQNGFVRYNERNFSWSDQERLSRAAWRARGRGAIVIVSNAHHREIKKMYRSGKFLKLTRQSTLSANPSKRRAVHEYLIIL
jgi:DNA adenine methylase